jgi:hypothetical protein
LVNPRPTHYLRSAPPVTVFTKGKQSERMSELQEVFEWKTRKAASFCYVMRVQLSLGLSVLSVTSRETYRSRLLVKDQYVFFFFLFFFCLFGDVLLVFLVRCLIEP